MRPLLLDAWDTWRRLATARAASHWPAARLRQHQEEQFRRLLQHAYDNVPLYRQLYDEAGFHPSQVRSRDDLERVPRLSKQRLKATPPQDRVARGTRLADCQVVPTSGSTGAPLDVYLGPADQRWQRAVAWRILFEHGFRWTDRTLEIRMAAGPTFLVQRLGIAPKDWVSILEPPAAWAARVARDRPAIIVACASTLHALAEAVAAAGRPVQPPRLIVSDSEQLMPATRQLVERILGTAPVDVYGLVELSNFAWQCARREGYHLSADSHLVEVAATVGAVGPVIATGLGMWTMPIIRYETGDLAEVEPQPCPCGRTLPRLRRLHGREADAVWLPDGRRLYWPVFHELLAVYPELDQWQVIQEPDRRVRVKLVIRAPATELTDRIRAALRAVVPLPVALELEPVGAIAGPVGEKFRAVVCRLPRGEVGP